jgi:hypothetical protein
VSALRKKHRYGIGPSRGTGGCPARVGEGETGSQPLLPWAAYCRRWRAGNICIIAAMEKRLPRPRRAALTVAAALAFGLSLGGHAVSSGEPDDGHAGHEGHERQGMLVLTRSGAVLTRMHPLDLHLATTPQRRRARALLERTRRAARARFPTLAAAQRRGYRGNPHRGYWWKWAGDRYVKVRGRPRLLHLDRPAYMHDGRLLDPRHPESLVYLRRSPGWKLIAFMYRAPTGPVPMPGGQITRWHLHGGCAAAARIPKHNVSVRDRRCPKGKVLHYGRTAMMHVWLGRTLGVGFSMSPPDELVQKTTRD